MRRLAVGVHVCVSVAEGLACGSVQVRTRCAAHCGVCMAVEMQCVLR